MTDDRFMQIVFSYSEEIDKTISKIYTQLKFEDIDADETRLKDMINFMVEFNLKNEIKKWK